jgi:phosphate:Na+ symporter
METSSGLNLAFIVSQLAGGLALFLFGLQLLTEALKQLAGARLETVLGTLSANRFRGVLAGAGVTALLNSSTITTVLMVGFVSAGLMTLGQTVPMIMGANVGSTLTAQIIAFDVSRLVPVMLALGFLAHAFAKQETLRLAGRTLLGLGLLFLGIQFMGDATRPLRTFQPFIDAMQEMRSPWVGVLAGALFTAVVQSSAATLAIVIALGSQGLMPLEAGIALILGANVGTCGTALLAAIGKKAEALQVGIVHLLFNVFGVLMFVFIIPQFADFVRAISPAAPELDGAARLAAETPRQVANAHTIFSVAGTLALIWFTTPIARLAQWIAPSKPAEPETSAPRFLDETALEVPALAVQRARLELQRLGTQIVDIVRTSTSVAVRGNVQDLTDLAQRNTGTEKLTTDILTYIGRIWSESPTEAEGEVMTALVRLTTTLESVDEIAMTNMVSVAERRLAGHTDLEFLHDESTWAFGNAVFALLDDAVHLIDDHPPEAIARVLENRQRIDALAAAARQSVLQRLRLDDQRDVLSFRLASDMIDLFEGLAHYAWVIAQSTRDL